MATNMPPYNLREIIEACLFGLENPDARAEEYLKIVKGPDFPTGAYIVGTKGIKEAMLSGRGSVKMRAVTDVEEIRKGRTAIIVRELPYQISQDRVLEKIAALVNDKKITGIADLRNESSSRVGTRLVIELKRDAVPQVVVNQLFKMTQLQDSFGVNAVALVDGVPRTLSVAEMIQYYLDHPDGGHRASHPVPTRQGRGAGPHPRRIDHRRRQHRRSDQSDPGECRHRHGT